jgi:hypothetical protein
VECDPARCPKNRIQFPYLYTQPNCRPQNKVSRPIERFSLADRTVCAADRDPEEDSSEYPLLKVPRPPGVNCWVDQRGKVRLGGFSYHVGPVFAGEPVDVAVQDGLVEILHAGVLVATHAERRKDSATSRPRRVPLTRPPRVATVGNPVSRSSTTEGPSASPDLRTELAGRGDERQSKWQSSPARFRSQPEARS